MTKAIITLIIISSVFGQIYSQSIDEAKYKLVIKKGEIVKDSTNTFLLIPATLTNQTNDTLKYFSKSCSWQEYYSVNNKNLEIETVNCDKNIPIILTLAPNQSATVDLRLLISQTIDSSPNSFKIGFHLLKDQVFMDMYDVSNQFYKNIIWSNEISI